MFSQLLGGSCVYWRPAHLWNFCESFWFVSMILFVRRELLSPPRAWPISAPGCPEQAGTDNSRIKYHFRDSPSVTHSSLVGLKVPLCYWLWDLGQVIKPLWVPASHLWSQRTPAPSRIGVTIRGNMGTTPPCCLSCKGTSLIGFLSEPSKSILIKLSKHWLAMVRVCWIR